MASTNRIKNLLKKKKWTGKEVGQLLIASLLNDMKQLKQEEKTPLFSQADFNKMESSLISDKDWTVYGVYRDLYSSILDTFNTARGLSDKFYNGYTHLYAQLREIENADDVQRSIDNVPLIVTESQYKRLKEETEKDLRGYQESYYSLLFSLLREFLSHEDKAPETVKAAIEATKGIPAGKISFSSSYNEQKDRGYCTLPDGRRSDQMPDAEWRRAAYAAILGTEAIDENGNSLTEEEYNTSIVIAAYKLLFDGAEAVKRNALERTGEELPVTDEDIEDFFDNLADEDGKVEASPGTQRLINALGFSNSTEWHTYEELPEGMTAYDLLEFASDCSDFARTTAERKAILKAFKADYKELYKALHDYIEENVPNAKGLKAAQLYKEIFSWGDLADAGVADYASLVQPDDGSIAETIAADSTPDAEAKYVRASNGIAIIQNPSSYQVDENGDYVERRKKCIQFSQPICSLEGKTEKLEQIHGYVTDFIYPALSYMYAFNALMEIIENVYDLPDLAAVTHCDTAAYAAKLEAFNTIVYIYNRYIYANNNEDRKHRREILKEVFIPMETERLKPSQEAIEELTEGLTKLGLSDDARREIKYLDQIINRLMDSREERE